MVSEKWAEPTSQKCLKKLDRAYNDITIEDIKEGMLKFRKKYHNSLIIEVLIVKTINDKQQKLKDKSNEDLFLQAFGVGTLPFITRAQPYHLKITGRETFQLLTAMNKNDFIKKAYSKEIVLDDTISTIEKTCGHDLLSLEIYFGTPENTQAIPFDRNCESSGSTVNPMSVTWGDYDITVINFTAITTEGETFKYSLGEYSLITTSNVVGAKKTRTLADEIYLPRLFSLKSCDKNKFSILNNFQVTFQSVKMFGIKLLGTFSSKFYAAVGKKGFYVDKEGTANEIKKSKDDSGDDSGNDSGPGAGSK